MEKLKGYSICSGIGGLDIAFQSEYIGGQTIGYCEYDTYCQNVLWRRMQDGWLDNAAIWPDLYTLEKSIVGNVDVLYGGIPCQPHSQAGKRAGADDPRDLWPKTLELLREVRPRLFFLENVTGITMGTGQQGAYVYRIFDDLCKIGYEFRWTTVRASDIGAPHRRERFFLLANSNDRFSEYENSAIRTRRSSLDDGSHQLGNTYEPLGSCELGDPGSWVRRTEYDEAAPRFVAYGLSDHSGSSNKYAIGEVDITEGLFQSFPPSPDSQDEWRGLIRRNASLSPAIEPNLRRGPDGLTPGLDKYRRKGLAALGNGVVPQQAILAWLLLKRNL